MHFIRNTKQWIAAALLLLFFASCESNYTVKGTIPTENKTDTLWAVCKGTSQSLTIPIIAKNGKFSFSQPNDSIDLISFILPGNSFTFSFIPSSKKGCNLTIADKEGIDVRIENDAEAEAYYKFRKEFIEESRKHHEVEQFMSELKKEDSLQRYQDLLIRDTLLRYGGELYDKTMEFIDFNFQSPYAALAFADFISVTHRYKPVYNFIRAKKLTGDRPRSLYNEMVKEAQESMFSLKNKTLPDFKLKPLDDWAQNINQYKRTTNLLLCFWDPSDNYSCYVAKQISGMEEKFHSNGMQTLLVAVTEDLPLWKEKVKELDLKGKQASTSLQEETGLRADYGLKNIPATYFLTRSDSVRFENLFAKELSDSLTNYFNAVKLQRDYEK